MPLVLGLVGLQSVTVAEDAAPWVGVQPGYPGPTRDAEGFMKSYSSYLASRTDLGALSGKYYNVPQDALRHLQARSPGFALVSLGFYL